MLHEAKSNLARLMATENLVIEERNVPTAFFDMKSRILTVPILNGNLSNYLYDLLLGHEVGHALETPATGWHDSVFDHKVNKDILNVCEDVRIEKKIKRKFPGLKYSFIRGYSELMDMDFFGVKGKDLNELNFIDRINLYTKGGASQGIEFSDEELPLLKEVETTETFDEVVIVAKKIQEFMKAELDKIPESKIKIKVVASDDDDGDGEYETINADEMEIDFDSIDAKSPQGKALGEEEGEGESSPGGGSSTSGGDSDRESKEKGDNAGSNASNQSTEQSIKSKTDEAFREKERQLYSDNTKSEIVYSEIPKLNLQNLIIGFKDVLHPLRNKNVNNPFESTLRENFNKYKNESNKVVSYLVKEFELRKNADQQSRAKISKTGELNMNKIHEYKFTDDIFERLTKIPNGKSHGLVMFIDWSGSMHEHLQATIKQLLNLVMFCKKVNIPFEVYAFTTQWKLPFGHKLQPEKVGDIVVTDFGLMNLFSSKMTPKEYTEMATYLLDFGTHFRGLTTHCHVPDFMTLGGTPLNQTIVAAFEIIPEFKRSNKLQIVNSVFLTDGESGTLNGRFSFLDPKTNKAVIYNEVVPTNRRRSIFRDPKTKATVEVEQGSGYGSGASMQTRALLMLLKQRAECNLMGFFIADSRSIRSAIELYGKYDKDYHKKVEQVEIKMKQFRKEKLFVVEDFGYDEYYLIKSNTLDTDDEELTVNSNTTRGLVSAFSKYTEGKISSRVILNRFIKLIA